MSEEIILLKEGDIIEIQPYHVVYAQIPAHFVYSNKKGCFDLVRGKANLSGELKYLTGEYVVYKTTMDGGGTCDGFAVANGHHVFCEKLDDRKVKIDFHQTGEFATVPTDIQPIGTAERQWVKEAK